MTSGNGLTVTYTASNKAKTITRGTTTIAFDHDPEHQRFAQTGPNGVTLYFSAFGVLAEKFGQLGGAQRWTNYLIVGGRLIGIHVENADETTLTRYFHTDHLGSVAVITNETGGVMERLSYDAWGLRRHPDGTPDPSGSIASQSTRGFTGHEHLADVGLIHMNGRVYDPLLARFGTPDPMTESPFSTQGWNRYSYVGNSPLNFTDPSGYCFLGCFWKPIFKAIGNFFKQNFAAIIQVAATALLCSGPLAPVCAGVVAFAVTGVTSGDLGLALRAGMTAFFTAGAMDVVGTATLGVEHKMPDFMSSAHVANMAGHALVGCASSVMQGGKCGPGALSGAAGSFAGPILKGLDLQRNLVAHAVVGGLASVAAGGKFANGAVTAAFGYLFNDIRKMMQSLGVPSDPEAYARAYGARQFAADAGRNMSLIGGFGGALAAGFGGGDASFGGYWNPLAEEGGAFASVGPAAGFNLGADVYAGFVAGSPVNLDGQAITQTLSIGFVSMTSIHHIDTFEFMGGTIGFGGGPFDWGYSSAITTTICTPCGRGKQSPWAGRY